MSAELKLFIDTTGPLWAQGKLIGKVAAVFCTNSTAHSGKESTLLSMMIPLFHHGLIVVGVPQNIPQLPLPARIMVPRPPVAPLESVIQQPMTLRWQRLWDKG